MRRIGTVVLCLVASLATGCRHRVTDPPTYVCTTKVDTVFVYANGPIATSTTTTCKPQKVTDG